MKLRLFILCFYCGNLIGQQIKFDFPDTVTSIFSPLILEMKIDSNYVATFDSLCEAGLLRLNFRVMTNADTFIFTRTYDFGIIPSHDTSDMNVFLTNTNIVAHLKDELIDETTFALNVAYNDSLVEVSPFGYQVYSKLAYPSALLNLPTNQVQVEVFVSHSDTAKVTILPSTLDVLSCHDYLYQHGLEIYEGFEFECRGILNNNSLRDFIKVQYPQSIYFDGILVKEFSQLGGREKGGNLQLIRNYFDNLAPYEPVSKDKGVKQYCKYLASELKNYTRL